MFPPNLPQVPMASLMQLNPWSKNLGIIFTLTADLRHLRRRKQLACVGCSMSSDTSQELRYMAQLIDSFNEHGIQQWKKLKQYRVILENLFPIIIFIQRKDEFISIIGLY